jgi:hypothetical protein
VAEKTNGNDSDASNRIDVHAGNIEEVLRQKTFPVLTLLMLVII